MSFYRLSDSQARALLAEAASDVQRAGGVGLGPARGKERRSKPAGAPSWSALRGARIALELPGYACDLLGRAPREPLRLAIDRLQAQALLMLMQADPHEDLGRPGPVLSLSVNGACLGMATAGLDLAPAAARGVERDLCRHLAAQLASFAWERRMRSATPPRRLNAPLFARLAGKQALMLLGVSAMVRACVAPLRVEAELLRVEGLLSQLLGVTQLCDDVSDAAADRRAAQVNGLVAATGTGSRRPSRTQELAGLVRMGQFACSALRPLLAQAPAGSRLGNTATALSSWGLALSQGAGQALAVQATFGGRRRKG